MTRTCATVSKMPRSSRSWPTAQQSRSMQELAARAGLDVVRGHALLRFPNRPCVSCQTVNMGLIYSGPWSTLTPKPLAPPLMIGLCKAPARRSNYREISDAGERPQAQARIVTTRLRPRDLIFHANIIARDAARFGRGRTRSGDIARRSANPGGHTGLNRPTCVPPDRARRLEQCCLLCPCRACAAKNRILINPPDRLAEDNALPGGDLMVQPPRQGGRDRRFHLHSLDHGDDLARLDLGAVGHLPQA